VNTVILRSAINPTFWPLRAGRKSKVSGDREKIKGDCVSEKKNRRKDKEPSELE
jgi:hypothetical protein